MEKIIYRVNPSFKECLKAQFIGFWLYRRARVSAVITCGFFLFVAILITEFPRYWYVFVAMIFFVLGMWSSAFLRLFQNASTAKKLYNKAKENDMHYLDEEKGLGFEEGTSKGCFGWDQFIFFKETKNFFFLQFKSGNMGVIFKSSLPQEKISSVRKMLQNAPAQEKYLYANK